MDVTKQENIWIRWMPMLNLLVFVVQQMQTQIYRSETNSMLHWLDYIWNNGEPAVHMITGNDQVIYNLWHI